VSSQTLRAAHRSPMRTLSGSDIEGVSFGEGE
jgi:hypothetical protein